MYKFTYYFTFTFVQLENDYYEKSFLNAWFQKIPIPALRGLGLLEIPKDGGFKIFKGKLKYEPKPDFQEGLGGYNPSKNPGEGHEYFPSLQHIASHIP